MANILFRDLDAILGAAIDPANDIFYTNDVSAAVADGDKKITYTEAMIALVRSQGLSDEQLLFADSNGDLTQDSGLSWDNTNKSLDLTSTLGPQLNLKNGLEDLSIELDASGDVEFIPSGGNVTWDLDQSGSSFLLQFPNTRTISFSSPLVNDVRMNLASSSFYVGMSVPTRTLVNSVLNNTYDFAWVAGSTIMTLLGEGALGLGLTPTATMTGLAIEDGTITIKETTTPTADTNYGKLYTKTDNKLYFQDGAGVEQEIAFV